MVRTWLAISVTLGLMTGFVGAAFGEVHGLKTYHVIGVSPSDPSGLNVRDNVIEAQSLGDTTIVGNLAWNAKGIASSGVIVEIGKSTWRQIRHGKTVGWVNEKYLAEDPVLNLVEVSPDKLRCSGTEPFWSLDMNKKSPKYNGTDPENGEWLENAELTPLASYPIVQAGLESWSTTLKLNQDDRNITALIRRAQPMCSDGVSNQLFPYEVIVLTGNVPRPVYGCCQINIRH